MELLERRCRLEWMIWGTCRTLIIIIKRKKIRQGQNEFENNLGSPKPNVY
jgi:hypothetical protein